MKIKIVTLKATSTIAILTIALFFLVDPVWAQDGEQLFQQCKACHTIGQGKLVGPDLLNVTKDKDHAWLKNFIKSSQTMIKKGDPQAVAIYEEFNKMMMIDYTHLSDADLDAMLKYIDSFSTQDATEAPEKAASDSLIAAKNAEFLASIDTDENEAKGKALFQGERKFKNGGASCVSCHHVNSSEMVQGGLLAKELTKSFTQLGGFAGIKGILGSPPFPAMKDAYAKYPITEDESIQLQVFLMRAEKKNVVAENSVFALMKKGILGVVVLLGFISLVWFKRKKRSVNYKIIQRQRR